MTERDIPESWSSARAKHQDNITKLSPRRHEQETQASGSATGTTSKSVKRSKESYSEQIPEKNQGSSSWKVPRLLKSWVFWTMFLTLVTGSIGFTAVTMLLKLPAAPNCPSIFWPLASASVRLHCAQLAASKLTVPDLLQAIELVNYLPKSHPMRAEVDRLIAEWSKDVLRLADESFQAGNIESAIATARKIPENVSASTLINDKITKWQSIWSAAESIYKESEAEIREQHWHQAFMISAKLLRVNNKYWAVAKYDEINRSITRTREESDKLAKAQDEAKNGSLDSIRKAIKVAQSIGQNSYIYQKAQDIIPDLGRKMLDIAQQQLDRHDADQAISIAQQIPANAKIQSEIQDFVTLAEAQRSAWTGTISGLQAAISQAQQIDATRPAYDKAQKLIGYWQLEAQDIFRLEKARSLASAGTINDLTAAIAEAQQIPASNPRGKEANQEISKWVAQVQTIQDRPYLDRADQIALYEDVNSLHAAIAEASQIHRGRALYREAQQKVATWTDKVQRIEDQPYLDQAKELAQSGNLPAAVATAQRIARGRALSSQAQAAIDDWQGQLSARENWQRAREVAVAGTPEALAQAIRLANRVPESSLLRNDVNVAMDQWSQQVLDIARSQGESDINRGIETAKLVPRGTAAYSAAREQIQTWRDSLKPPEPPQPEPQQPEQQPEQPQQQVEQQIIPQPTYRRRRRRPQPEQQVEEQQIIPTSTYRRRRQYSNDENN